MALEVVECTLSIMMEPRQIQEQETTQDAKLDKVIETEMDRDKPSIDHLQGVECASVANEQVTQIN